MLDRIRRLHARTASRRRRIDRLQVAALPFRRGDGGAIEVLLVTSRGTGRWIIPKGNQMNGLSLAEAAAQEALEEAGVRGRIATREAGRFSHLKTRSIGRALHCRVAVFALAVEEELDEWPEQAQRQRRWFSIREAQRAVASRELAGLIAGLERPEEE